MTEASVRIPAFYFAAGLVYDAGIAVENDLDVDVAVGLGRS